MAAVCLVVHSRRRLVEEDDWRTLQDRSIQREAHARSDERELGTGLNRYRASSLPNSLDDHQGRVTTLGPGQAHPGQPPSPP
jgi:hypothetical protein